LVPSFSVGAQILIQSTDTVSVLRRMGACGTNIKERKEEIESHLKEVLRERHMKYRFFLRRN
jgi:hypothetical protein